MNVQRINGCARKYTWISLVAVMLHATVATPAPAAPGDCAAPLSADAVPRGSDCLLILRVAVGSAVCPQPVCTCDADGTNGTTAIDALLCMKTAVGITAKPLNCPCPCAVAGGACDAALGLTLTVRPDSELDAGWKGTGHDAELPVGSSLALLLGNPCTNSGSCEIIGTTGTRRCLADAAIVCDSDAQCANAGGRCRRFFGPPLPLTAGGTPACVLSYFEEDLTGTFDFDSGALVASARLRSRVHFGETLSAPCPRCGAPGTGVRVGDTLTCSSGRHKGCACTVEAVSQEFGGLSSDCPPDVTNNISGVGLAIALPEITTKTTTMTATLPCGPPFDRFHPSGGEAFCLGSGAACASNDDCPQGVTCGLYCHCGFCDDGGGLDPDRPCSGDAECGPGATCRAGTTLNQAQPNGCQSFVCGETSPEQCCSAEGAECTAPTSGIGECNRVSAACRTDSECVIGGNGDRCIIVDRPCFENTIVRTGADSPFGRYCVEDPEIGACTSDADCNVGPCLAESAEPTAVALFCIPPTASSTINSAGGIPGPGAARLRASLELAGTP